MLLTAFNIVGESPASAPVEVFVGEAGKPWRVARPSALRAKQCPVSQKGTVLVGREVFRSQAWPRAEVNDWVLLLRLKGFDEHPAAPCPQTCSRE